MPELAAPGRDNALLALVARCKWGFFALAAGVILLSFNGLWRVGRDSAAYRGLGHHLATRGQYVFRDKQGATAVYSDQQDTRYPGLPLILAGVEKVFGRATAPAASAILATGNPLVRVASYRAPAPALLDHGKPPRLIGE